MLDPRRLLTFREVARHGSFSRAAAALSLSQPAVSYQVGALERELGTALLVRGRAGTAPTPAGELLLAHADALAATLALADAQMDAALSGERRTLRLGAVPSALATLVPAALEALRGGELEIEAEEGTTAALAEAVRSGRLHAAVAFQDAAAPRREHAGTRRVDLGEDPLLALVGAPHPLADREEIGLRELARDPWMVPERDGLHVAACRAAGFEPRVVILTRDPLAACAIAAAGLAVSLTPRLTPVLPGVATLRLTRPPRRAIYALLPATGAHPLADALIAALRAAAQATSS